MAWIFSPILAISFAVPLGLRPTFVLPYRIPPSLLHPSPPPPHPTLFSRSRAREPANPRVFLLPPPSPSLFRVTHLLYPYPSPSLGLSLATHKPLPPDCRRSRLPRPPPRVLSLPPPPPPSPSPLLLPRSPSPHPPLPRACRARFPPVSLSPLSLSR